MNSKNNRNETSEEKPIVIRNTTDLQRLKLEKLMKNPDKPVLIPEKPKGKSMPPVPDFVRNVMGSSAGAGSGEFHVYRHLRRKEYARQKFIQEKSEREKMDDEYHQKLEDNKKKADEKTAKNRAKRLKRKMRAKDKGKKKIKKESSSESSELDESEEEKDSNDESKSNSNSTKEEENSEDSNLKTEMTEDSTQNKLCEKTECSDENMITENKNEVSAEMSKNCKNDSTSIQNVNET